MHVPANNAVFDRLRVLIACGDGTGRHEIAGELVRMGMLPLFCETACEIVDRVRTERIDLVFCPLRMRDGTFRHLLSDLTRSGLHVPVVVVGREAERTELRKTTEAGAFRFIVYPSLSENHFGEIVRGAILARVAQRRCVRR